MSSSNNNNSTYMHTVPSLVWRHAGTYNRANQNRYMSSYMCVSNYSVHKFVSYITAKSIFQCDATYLGPLFIVVVHLQVHILLIKEFSCILQLILYCTVILRETEAFQYLMGISLTKPLMPNPFFEGGQYLKWLHVCKCNPFNLKKSTSFCVQINDNIINIYYTYVLMCKTTK